MQESSDTYQQPDSWLSIGDVARAFGVTVPTVRNWCRAGLIKSERTPGNQRRFRSSEVDRVRAASDAGEPVR